MASLKAKIYTDGSANPNPGTACGWGMYGYTYVDTVTFSKPSDTKGIPTTVEVIKDSNGKPAKPVIQKEWEAWGGLEGKADNNQAEIQGITEAIKYAVSMDIKELEIRSDSKLALNGGEKWMDKWKSRGWRKADGNPVPYQQRWEDLDHALTTAGNMDITWTWVKGHSGVPGNERADKCAKKGGSLAREEKYESVFEMIQESVDGKITKPKKPKTPPYNRLFMHNKWYFCTNVGERVSNDGRFIYTLGNHSENELYGKRVSDDSMSVIFLKEEEPVLAKLRAKQDDVGDEYSVPIYGRMDAIRGSKIYPDIYHEGTDYLQTNKIKALSTVDGKVLTEPAQPTGLAFIGLESLDALTRRLEDYLSESEKVVVTDVTDLFYVTDTDSKGKEKLVPSKEITDNAKFLTTKAKYSVDGKDGERKVVLTIGMDAPTKNMLTAMSKLAPTIKVITWQESKKTIRYAVVVETEDDVGLYSSTCSNLCLV